MNGKTWINFHTEQLVKKESQENFPNEGVSWKLQNFKSRLSHDHLELSFLTECETFWWQLMRESATIVLPRKSFKRD